MAQFIGGSGQDSYDGGAADDTIYLQAGDDVGKGFGGNDIVDGGLGNDRVFGGLGNDRLFSGPAVESGKDSLYGGAGDDEMTAGFGDFGDLADGGTGIDHIILNYSAGFAVSGTPLIITLSPSFFVFAGAAIGISVQNVERLSVSAADGADNISGGAYDDYIDGRAGNDSLFGGDGDDWIAGGTGDFLIGGGLGIDYLSLDMSDRSTDLIMRLTVGGKLAIAGIGTATGFERVSLAGGSGNDVLEGRALDDSLNGNDGNDRLTGGVGVDSLDGGSGVDTLFGGDGNDRMDGRGQDDAYYGGLGDDYMSEAPVTLSGNDTMYGGDGNDRLAPGLGDDTLYGGNGDDFLELDGGNDLGYGGDGNDFMRDDLYSPRGNDTLYGGNGNDTITLSEGNDQVDAGGGDDLVSVQLETGTTDVLDGGAGRDRLSSGGGNTETLVIVATVTGSSLTFIRGGVSMLTAVNFEDFALFGGQMADSLTGGAGNDTLRGNAGFFLNPQPALDIDTLTGGAGNDILVGRDAADRMSGGTGADSFIYEKITDSGVTVASRDLILGFQTGLDKIDLALIDADLGLTGDQAFTLVAAFGGAVGQAVIASVVAGRWLVSLDQTGDGTADLMIDVRGVTLAAGDLIL